MTSCIFSLIPPTKNDIYKNDKLVFIRPPPPSMERMTKVISYRGFKTTKYLFPAKTLGDNISIYFFNPLRKRISLKGISLKGSFQKNWHLRKDEGALNGLLSPITPLKFNRKKHFLNVKKMWQDVIAPPSPPDLSFFQKS